MFVATAPVDLRKSYDGLSRVAREALGQDPLSGHLFVFANRRRDRIKMFYWDRDGYAALDKEAKLSGLHPSSPLYRKSRAHR